jgi:GTP cyclohydrolase I
MHKDTPFVASLVEDKTDPVLGMRVRAHLQSLGLDNTRRDHYNPRIAFDVLEKGIQAAYDALGIDPLDPSTKETPKRFAKMFVGELTRGLNYDFFPKCTSTPNGNVEVRTAPETRNPVSSEDTNDLVKVGGYDEAVMVKWIRTTSLCEHHLQTIDGFTHIAYIPRDTVIGLSKLARVAEFFAARPQIQERYVEQVYHALHYILGTPDIGVVVDSVHFCMRARGVKQPESWTQTNKMGGKFMEKESLREEFLGAIALNPNR